MQARQLIGRIDIVTSLGDAVAGGGRVVIEGPVGVGKTSVARVVADRRRAAGAPVHWVQGLPGLRTVPLGALQTSTGTTEAVAAAGRLRADLAGDGALCVVDDLQWIDDRTLAEVQQVLTASAAGLLATTRAGERLGDAHLALLRATGAEVLPMAPLDDDEVAELAAAVLGAPPDRSLRRSLSAATGGNPLFAIELLESARAAGVLHLEHGTWRARGPLAPSTLLREVVAGRVDGLDEPAREAAEVLAVAERLPLADAERVVGADALARLDRASLLAVDAGEDATSATVALAHPVHGEVLRDQLGPVARRATLRRLVDGLDGSDGLDGLDEGGSRVGDPTAPRQLDVLRWARWHLELDLELEPAVRDRALGAALDALDLDTAERLARRAWIAEPSAVHGTTLATILQRQQRYDEAAEVQAAIATLSADDRQRVTSACLDAFTAFHFDQDPERALAVVREAGASVQDTEGRIGARAVELYVLVIGGRFGDCFATIAAVEELTVPWARPALRQLVAGFAMVQGRFVDAMALFDTPLLSPTDLFLSAEDAEMLAVGLHAVAEAMAGRPADGAERAAAAHEAASERHLARATADPDIALAFCALTAGRPAEAGRRAATAIAAFEGLLDFNSAVFAHALALDAAVATGDAERAAEERAALAARRDGAEQLYRAFDVRAEAAARAVLDGDADGALALLAATTDALLAEGAAGMAGELVGRALELGADPADWVARADACVVPGQGELVDLRAAAVRAAAATTGTDPVGGDRADGGGSAAAVRDAGAAADPLDELDRVAGRLEALECRRDAAWVLDLAATAAARRGATRRSRALRHRADACRVDLSAELLGPVAAGETGAATDGPNGSARVSVLGASGDGGGPEPAEGPLATLAPIADERWALLTAREREVAALAARGLPSKRIAAELALSRRTVDHALGRVYAKLGIAGRVDLVGRAVPPA